MLIDQIRQFTAHQKILVLGLGSENTQFMEWAVKVAGIDPKVFVLADQREIKTGRLESMKFFNSNQGFARDQIYFGDDYMVALERSDIEYIIKSPGIWSLDPSLVEFRRRKGEDRVISSLVFFFEKYGNQIVGVTGTKGKTTTSGLIASILAGLDDYEAFHCGNSTNISPYKYWDEIDSEINAKRYFVIELSSFQLQDLGFSRISPAFAIITNYFVDHLDQHDSKEEYWSAKNNIFLHQKTPCLITTNSVPQDVTAQANLVTGKSHTLLVSKYLSSPLLGEHNLLNLTQSLQAISLVLGVSLHDLLTHNQSNIQDSINTFKNLPYRLQISHTVTKTITIDEHSKQLTIRFVNDGAATEPEAVLAALDATTDQAHDFLWVQFSGKDKGGDVDGIINKLLEIQTRNRLYRVNYCGEIGHRILTQTYEKMKVPVTVDKEKLKDTVKTEFHSDIHQEFEDWLNELVQNLNSIGSGQEAMKLIESPNFTLTVLLSPCGSSFDEFNNYIERSKFWDKMVSSIYPQ